MANLTRSVVATAVVAAIGFQSAHASAADRKSDVGVYEYVIDRAQGSVAEVAAALEGALTTGGWRVLANVESGAPQGCRFRARVVSAVDLAWAGRVMAVHRKTAPFAIVDRINVFEDEAGVHVAIMNAESVHRTVFMDDARESESSRAQVGRLRALIGGMGRGSVSTREFGQVRSSGYIGKTMGVMAGGAFGDQVNDEAVVPGSDWRGVAERVTRGLTPRGPKWGFHVVYALELADQETVVLGTTGTPMDSQSFSIVDAGADEKRASYACPGLAHAAAYPIEIVVTRDRDVVRVRMVDAMYRMKLYFEDAGKWAFMKNMGMPGSIHDELSAQIKAGLATK